MDRIKMILDCDVGHDDAVALMVAARHPALELLGVTAVAGNQTLDKTLPNTLHVCQHLGLDVPVYSGMSLPMVRDQVTAGDVHGESGLDGPVFEPLTWKRAEEEHAEIMTYNYENCILRIHPYNLVFFQLLCKIEKG